MCGFHEYQLFCKFEMFGYTRTICIWLIISILFATKDGHAFFNPKKIFTRNILFKEGLSQCVINDIVQDNKGFIWAGTLDGLNQFDGSHVKIFRHDPTDKFSLPSSKINKLMADSQAHLYINTAAGFCVFDYETERAFRPPFAYKMQNGWVGIKNKMQIWAFYQHHTLAAINTQTFREEEKYTSTYNLIGDVIEILNYENKVLTISNRGEILMFDTTSKKFQYYTPQHVTLSEYTCAGLDKFHHVFIGGGYSDLLYFNTINKQYTNSPFAELSEKVIGINDMLYSPYFDMMFFTSYGQGLFVYCYNKKELLHFKKNSKDLLLSNNYPLCITQNKQGVLFIGNEGTGIDILDPNIRKFVPYVIEDDDDKKTLKYARKITATNSGDIYIGTSGSGLVKYDTLRHQYSFYNSNNTALFDDDFITELLYFQHKIWIGFNNSGIGIFNPLRANIEKKIDCGNLPNQIKPGAIWALFPEDDHTIWVGSKENGLQKINTNTQDITYYGPDKFSAFKENGIRTIIKKDTHTLYLGCENGLYVFDTKKETLQLVLGDLPNGAKISVKCIWIDSKYRIWLGTDGSGIIVLNTAYQLIQHLHTGNYLKNNVVYSILPENDSTIWFSSNMGISSFQFNVNQLSKSNYYHIRHFDELNGLQSNEFNSGAGYKLSNGLLAFGGINGVNIFNPTDIKDIHYLPEVYISNFKVFENKLKTPKQITYIHQLFLKPFENAISIEFNSLGYTLPEKNKYRYQLKGYDKDWIYADYRNYVSYTNLPPGDYTFMVAVCNYDGVWNPNYASLTIHIATPYYKTWWFMAIVFLVLTQLSYWGYTYRSKQIKEKENMRIAYNKELAEVELKALRAQINPHFIFNSLNSINNFILKNETKKASRYLVKFSQLVRNILNNSTSTYITLAEELKTIELYMLIEGMRFNEQFSYQIDISNQINTSTISIPSLLLQPYVENAIWHGLLHKEGEKHIKIDIQKINEETVSISIEDNGIGRIKAKEIEQQMQHRRSFGMQIGEDRLKLIQQSSGKLAAVEVIDCYNSQHEATGTTIRIVIPAIIFNEENNLI